LSTTTEDHVSVSGFGARGLIPEGLPRTLTEVLALRVAEKGDEQMLKCEGTWLSWSDVDQRTDRVAAGLQAAGLGKGDRMAHLSTTSLPMIATYLAGMKAGVVQIPMNIYLKGEFLRFQLAHSKVSIVAVDNAGLPGLLHVLPDLPEVRQVLLLEPDAADVRLPDGVTLLSFATLEGCRLPFEKPALLPTDLFHVMYSSGTTGSPKGCMISHRHALRIAGAVAWQCSVTADDLYYDPWPMNHVSGLAGPLLALFSGIPVILESAIAVEGLIERLATEGVTFFCALGPVPAGLLGQPASPFDRGHSIRMSQMAPCPPDLAEALEARFGFAVNAEVYGQSECCNISTSPTNGTHRNRASNGRPMPDLDVMLLDEQDCPVPAGEAGEICIRPLTPESMFDGYLDDPAATLAAMRSMWFHTGDIGVLDEEGFLTFVDRKKDMMRRNSENISSFEVETALRRHPAIINAAVHETSAVMASENDIVAWLQVTPDAVLTPEDLAPFLWDTVPYFALPRYIRFATELPMTPSGRVQKFKLRERPVAEGEELWDLKALGLLTPLDRRR
jgi:crotonobetaine/carnitine-CoA ligase